MDTLTIKDTRQAVRMLKRNKLEEPMYFIENEHWYQGEVAKYEGFECSKEELELAKLHKHGYIKMAKGVDLYLSRPIGVDL